MITYRLGPGKIAGRDRPATGATPLYDARMQMRIAAALLTALALQPSGASPRIVIAIGTALDGRGGVLRNTRLVIQDGKIAAIDPSASPIDIDLRNRTVSPGWIDTHVHLNWHFDDQH